MPRTRSLAWSELKVGLISVVAIVIASVLIFMVSGAEVGSVTKLNFVGDKVEVTMEVSKEQRQRITDLSTATLGSVSLLGEAAVDISANSKGTPIPEWGYVRPGV